MELDRYYLDVVLPCRGFNLLSYMSGRSPLEWDFAKIREEVAQLEEAVAAVKAVSA